MSWIRHGKIFDPANHTLPAGCFGFAQSPQALVFDDFVRVYFSTRARDGIGQFVSHVAYVDFRKDFRTVIGVSPHPVLPPGELGTFDEHGIFPLHPVRTPAGLLAYTCGWSRRVSVAVETAIGLAISHDEGKTFQRLGPGPVLAASRHEPCLVGDGFVRILDGVFHMWYIFGTGWRAYPGQQAPDRTYKIGQARSTDGVHWVKREGVQIVADVLGPDESQALPTVIEIDGRHHLFFCFRESADFRANAARGYRLGHACSDDLIDWTRDDRLAPSGGAPGEWDADMQCYPHVFACDGRILMLYNGNAFGREGFGLAEWIP